MKTLRRFITLIALISLSSFSTPLFAFCGFYVAKADTQLFNKSSQVVMMRDGNRNVITMASDYQGDAKDFAMVIPVPTILKKKQIHITNNAIIKHLDAYSSPRLVEYHDANPCQPSVLYQMTTAPAPTAMMRRSPAKKAKNLGVTIEAQYTVGEYDILLLSAKDSLGLMTWLSGEGYQLPKGAEAIVGSYLKQGMKFFVAKVNLKEFSKTGFTQLRPIQIAYNHAKFMLPIRLGTVNAQGKQELFVFALTRNGRVETTNYRTVKLPTNINIPAYIKDQKLFGRFYKDMFKTQVEKQKGKAVFLEYAWNMNWCDPCAADPLSNKELKELGVFWLNTPPSPAETTPAIANPNVRMMPPRPMPAQAKAVYITRLHLRYDRESFPEDLMFQVTGDKSNFQGRYIIQHPWKGAAQCEAGDRYFNEKLPKRFEQEAKQLANLTHWDITKIRQQQKIPKHTLFKQNDDDDDDWINSLWN